MILVAGFVNVVDAVDAVDWVDGMGVDETASLPKYCQLASTTNKSRPNCAQCRCSSGKMYSCNWTRSLLNSSGGIFKGEEKKKRFFN